MRYIISGEKYIDRIEQELGINNSARSDGTGITKQVPSRLRSLVPVADALMDAHNFGGGLGNGWIVTDGRSVEHAFLEGAEGMQVTTYTPQGKLGVVIQAHLDFNAGAVEQRGVQLNAGAAS